MTLAVRVPATTANLGPGFDALGAAVSRYLVAGVDEGGTVRVRTTGEGEGELATGDDNLIWRSVVAFCDHVGAPVPDVRLHVVNDIPLERGMGSSSSAIVAGLLLAKSLTDTTIGDLDLVALATEIEGHPDNVAPAILGGFVACGIAADGALVVRRAQPRPAQCVIAYPPTRQNTNEARGVLPESLSRPDVAIHAARAVHVAGAVTGTWPADVRMAGDLLHEPARFGVMQDSGALVEALRGAGVHAWLSGAGPSVAAMVTSPAAAADVVASAERAGFVADALDWDLSGAVACTDDRCPVSGLAGCPGCPRTRL